MLTLEAGDGFFNGHREYTLGWRFSLEQRGPTTLELQLDAMRREPAGSSNLGSRSGAGNGPEHTVALTFGAR